MKSVRQVFTVSLGLSLVCLIAAYWRLRGGLPIFIGVLIGAQWAVMIWKGRRGYPFSFLGLLALLVYGAAVNLPGIWLLTSLVALLVAWDTGEFAAHLSEFDVQIISPLLVRNHLTRILYVAVAGLVIGGSALVIRIRLEFGAAVLLGLLVITGLARAVRTLRGNL